jgi:hypothetical protein
MAVIKTLDILLRGRTEALTIDLQKGQRVITRFASSIRGTLIGMIPAVSLGGLIAGFTAGIKSAMTELDGLAKRSVQFSIDPGELGSLERAAGLAGVEVNGLMTGLKFFNRTISESIDGSKLASETLAKLGLEANTLEKMTVTERLLSVADAMQAIQSDTAKTTLLLKLFGKQGVALYPLLANGAEDLRTSLKKTKSLGGIFTTQQLSLVEQANDRFDDFKFTMSNIFKTIAIEVAPSLEKMWIALTDLVKPGSAFREVLLEIGRSIPTLITGFKDLFEIVKTVSDFLGNEAIAKLAKFAVFSQSIALANLKLFSFLKGKTFDLLGIDKAVEDADALGKKLGSLSGLGIDKPIRINPSPASRGSQEAFAAVYGVKIQAPINELIGVAKQGNGLLGEINNQLARGGIPAFAQGQGEDFI